jgi:predicted alpha/beta-hydrolase family hydrolase
MSEPLDLTAYVERVAAALAPAGASQEAVNLAHVRARRVVEALRPELERAAAEDVAIRALVAYCASAASGEPVEQLLKTLDAIQSQDDSEGESDS